MPSTIYYKGFAYALSVSRGTYSIGVITAPKDLVSLWSTSKEYAVTYAISEKTSAPTAHKLIKQQIDHFLSKIVNIEKENAKSPKTS